jgi:hypothetical protein
MKGKRAHKETGGVNEPEEDTKTKNENRSFTGDKSDPSPAKESEEMKKGGRAKRAKGGKAGFGPEKHGSDEKKVGGDKPFAHAGRKPRKSGGRTGSENQPFTSARKGEDAPGRKLMKGEYGMGED